MLKHSKIFNHIVSLGADCTPPHYFKSIITIGPFDHVFMPVRSVAEVVRGNMYDMATMENLAKQDHVRPVCDSSRVFDSKFKGEIWHFFKSSENIEDQYVDFRKQFEEAIGNFEKVLKSPKPVLFIRKHNEFESMWEIFLNDIEDQYASLVDSIKSVRKGDFKIIAIGSSPIFRKLWSVNKVSNYFITSSEDLKKLYSRVEKMVKYDKDS